MAARSGEGRLANVTGAFWLGRRQAQDTSCQGIDRGIDLLSGIFEVVLLVGDPQLSHPSARTLTDGDELHAALRAVLQTAKTPRVLWLDVDCCDATPEKLLALTAWPDHEVVLLPGANAAAPTCALLDRDAVLARVGALEGDTRAGLGALLRDLDVSIMDDPELVPAATTK